MVKVDSHNIDHLKHGKIMEDLITKILTEHG